MSQDQRSVVGDPALHVKTKPRPCRAKRVSGKCCRYRGNGQFVVVSSVCSGGVTRYSNWRPTTSKKRGVFISFDVKMVKSFLGWRQQVAEAATRSVGGIDLGNHSNKWVNVILAIERGISLN